jgi:HK97 family phage portal protein
MNNRRSAVKTIANIPAWAEVFNSGEFSDADRLIDTSGAYSKVPLVFRAVNIRCKSLTAIPFHLHKGKSTDVIEWDDIFTTPFKGLLWHIEASKLLSGFCLCLINDNVVEGRRFGLQWLNPVSVTIDVKQEKDENGLPKTTRTFKQRVNSVEYGPWTDDQVVFFRDFNPADDIGKGLAAAQVALGSAQLRHYVRRFASYFFEGGTMPVTVLGVEGNPSPEEMKRTEDFFKRASRMLRNAFNVIALRGTIKPFNVNPPLDTLDMPGLNELTVKDIAFAFEIPETLLTDAANFATAVENMQSYYTDTVIPRADDICEVLNDQFLDDVGYTIEADPEEMSIFQEDEADRAQSLSLFMDAIEKCKTEEMALAMLAEFGFDLEETMIAAIRGYFQTKQENAAVMAENLAQKPNVIEPVPQQDGINAVPSPKSLALAAWRKFALRQLHEGNSPASEFKNNYIDDEDRQYIMSELAKATTANEIKVAFAMKGDDQPDAVSVLEGIRLGIEALKYNESHDELGRFASDGGGGGNGGSSNSGGGNGGGDFETESGANSIHKIDDHTLGGSTVINRTFNNKEEVRNHIETHIDKFIEASGSRTGIYAIGNVSEIKVNSFETHGNSTSVDFHIKLQVSISEIDEEGGTSDWEHITASNLGLTGKQTLLRLRDAAKAARERVNA